MKKGRGKVQPIPSTIFHEAVVTFITIHRRGIDFEVLLKMLRAKMKKVVFSSVLFRVSLLLFSINLLYLNSFGHLSSSLLHYLINLILYVSFYRLMLQQLKQRLLKTAVVRHWMRKMPQHRKKMVLSILRMQEVVVAPN